MKARAPAAGSSQVEDEKATDARAPAARNSESQEIKPCVLKQSWQTNTLIWKEKVIKLEQNFENNLDITWGEILFEVPKTDFGKLTRNRARAEAHTLLSGLGDSVGHLRRHSGKSVGSATCLVLKGLCISTCRHVIYRTVGEDIEAHECARTLSQCVKVTFAYEKAEDENKHCFSVERWFETSDVELDYPVLKLKRNGQQVPEGLHDGNDPEPDSRRACIVGHPDGEVKYSDASAVIPQNQREETYLEHIRARAADGCGACVQNIHMHTQRSFQETVPQPDVVTHNTASYFGSSGFPVFDSEGSLVAMHTASFTCKYPQGISSIIEFNCTLKSIMYDIKKKT
ncbi:serine protease FAM111A-like [Cervus canadensis]|uniref:serine protease FAM111A-like n=1 Tax=Cervus canadensis TaxID=1574408 RepID=UPI001C9E4EFA|nr:serine protease FAM111A-like [Cervus canadensis]